MHETASYEFGVLGPLEVRVRGKLLRIPGAKPRTLLALLLLHANEPVSADRLVDDLWGPAPPEGAKAALHVHVAQLRRVLEPDRRPRSAGDVLVTTPAGYLLRAGNGAIDSDRFEDVAAEGRDLLAAGRSSEAASRLRSALELWRGPALADFLYESWARGEADRLEELRLACLEDRIQADLDLGRHGELVGELETLVGEHPLRERFRAQLMLALYRAGRQAEALDAYREARQALVEALGIDPSPKLRDLESAILRQDDALEARPLADHSPTNLPRPASSFVGREGELQDVISRVRDGARLLTLTGPGGTGKTRLAIEAASSLRSSFRAGVFWVGLASLRDPELVTATITQTLGAKDGLVDHIGESELLLLLDNLEQVIEAAPELSQLLQACSGLTLLVTSRELLRVQGEVEYPVPPLAEAEAVTLFCERAQTEPSEEIAELCARLDALPLAVELAAARTKALAPTQILERLASRLDLLTGGRDADPRQQTLRATMEWSHDLLTNDEQTLFARLGIFAGGCTLEAAEQICEAGLDTLQSLVTKSLVRHSDDRFWMLETIREYAAERLRENADAASLHQNHAAYYLALAEHVEPKLELSFGTHLPTVSRELGNLRAALAWFASRGDHESRIRLAGALWRFWLFAGNVDEAASWLERPEKPLPPAVEALALRAQSWVLAAQGRHEEAARAAEDRLQNARASGDLQAVSGSLMLMADLAKERGDDSNALRLFEESVAAARKSADELSLVAPLLNLGVNVRRLNDFDRARALIQEALSVLESREIESDVHWAAALATLALVAVHEDAPDASVTVRRSIVEAQRVGWESLLPKQLDAGALIAARTGDVDTSMLFVGAADALRARLGQQPDADERELRALVDSEVDAQFSPEQLLEARRAASALPLDEAIRTAIASLD